MKIRTIISLLLSTCFLFSSVGVYAKDGPNLASNSAAESYISFLDSEGNPTDLFYSSGGVISDVSTMKGARYEQSTNTLYLSGISTNQSLECSTMGDDFKIHVTGQNSIGQITVWGDGYGGSLAIEGNGTLAVNNSLTYTKVPAILMRADGAKASFSVSDSVKVTLQGSSSMGSLAILSTTLSNPLTAIHASLTAGEIKANPNEDSTYDYQVSASSITLSKSQTENITSSVSLKKTKITSVIEKKKSLILKWKKTAHASYYQVQISKNAKFHNATVKIVSANSLKIKKLTRKQTYYIRVRSCNTSSGTLITSAWSTKKRTKTK